MQNNDFGIRRDDSPTGVFFGLFTKADENIALASGRKDEPDASFWDEDSDGEENLDDDAGANIQGLEATLLETPGEKPKEPKKYANDARGRRKHIEDESAKVLQYPPLSSPVHSELH